MLTKKTTNWRTTLLPLLLAFFVFWQVYLLVSISPQLDNPILNEAAENLLLNGYSWNAELTEQFWTFRDWTIKNGLRSDLYLLDRLGIFVLKSADILRYEPQKAGVLPALFISLHFYILKFGFLLIATWKFILLASLISFLMAKRSIKTYIGQNLLGQLPNGEIFDSDLHLKRGAGERQLPDGQLTGLLYPAVAAFEKVEELHLYRSLSSAKCINDTNCDLIGIICSEIQALNKADSEAEDKKLSYLFETELSQFPLEVVIKYGNSLLSSLLLAEMAAAKLNLADRNVDVTARGILFSLPAFVFDYSSIQRDFVADLYSCVPFVDNLPILVRQPRSIALTVYQLVSLRNLILNINADDEDRIKKQLGFGLRLREELNSMKTISKNGLNLIPLGEILPSAKRVISSMKIDLKDLTTSAASPKRQLLALEIAGKLGLEISQANTWLELLDILEQLKFVPSAHAGSSRLFLGDSLVPFEKISHRENSIYVGLVAV